MARPKKGTVDYFPHYVHHGKTLYILENLYGNDGYAFFYKLLEVLADSDGHFYDCRDATAWEFLQAKTRTDEVSTCSILDKLSNMGIIDPELWKIRVIWMETFVHSVKDVYVNRRVSTPTKPNVSEFLHVETQDAKVSTPENTQSKVKESKVKSSPLPGGTPSQDFLDSIKASPAYKHIDLEIELAKMDVWLSKPVNKRRKKTPTFILNWLNKIEVPVNGNGKQQPAVGLTPDAEQRIREIEERENGGR